LQGGCEYIEKTVANSIYGVVLQLGGWARGLTTSRKEKACYDAIQGLGFGRIHGRQTWK